MYHRDNYRAYYEALLMYFEDFTLLFRLLSESNSSMVPPLDNKEYGLLKIMISPGHIDKGYFQRTKADMTGKTYTNVTTFINLFKDIMKKHYDAYMNYNLIPHEKDMRSYSDRKDDNHKDRSPSKTSNSYHDNKRSRPNSRETIPVKSFFERHPLHNLKETDGDRALASSSSSDEWDNTWNKDSDEDNEVKKSNPDSDEDDEASKHFTNQYGEEDSHQCAMSGDNMQQLNAIAGEFNKHATVPVCIAAAIYGNCYRIDDQKHSRAFSHDKVLS